MDQVYITLNKETQEVFAILWTISIQKKDHAASERGIGQMKYLANVHDHSHQYIEYIYKS